MFKLFRKKSKKGFTLAELLVVVAIIAILVAVAIPVFMSSLTDARIRVNQANVRSVRAAGVTAILTNWEKNVSGTTAKVSSGAKDGWYALAEVDTNGNISNLVILNATTANKGHTGIWKNSSSTTLTTSSDLKSSESDLYTYASGFDIAEPKYVVQVYIADTATVEAAGG